LKKKIGIVMVTVLVLTLIFCLGTAQAAVQEKNASVEKSFEKAVSSSLKEVGANGSLVSFTRRHLGCLSHYMIQVSITVKKERT
jgi:hypothetical protein